MSTTLLTGVGKFTS